MKSDIVNRRDFIKKAGLGTLSAAMSSVLLAASGNAEKSRPKRNQAIKGLSAQWPQ